MTCNGPSERELAQVAAQLEGLGLSDSDTEREVIRQDGPPSVEPERGVPLALLHGPWGRMIDGIPAGLNPVVTLRMKLLLLGHEGSGKTCLTSKAISLRNRDGRANSSVTHLITKNLNLERGNTPRKQTSNQNLTRKKHTSKESPRKDVMMNLGPSLEDIKIQKKAASDKKPYIPTIAVNVPLIPAKLMPPPDKEPPGVLMNWVLPILLPRANLLVEMHCIEFGGGAPSLLHWGSYYNSFADANAVMLVCDVTNPKSYVLQKWLEKMKIPQRQQEGVPVPHGCVVGAKQDLLYDTVTKKMRKSPTELSQNQIGWPYFETTIYGDTDECLWPFHHLAEVYAAKYRAREEQVMASVAESGVTGGMIP